MAISRETRGTRGGGGAKGEVGAEEEGWECDVGAGVGDG